ncbi:MAG: hypothetical protein QXH80_03530, partial [Candidatus Nanoarchaeia archaeon]
AIFLIPFFIKRFYKDLKFLAILRKYHNLILILISAIVLFDIISIKTFSWRKLAVDNFTGIGHLNPVFYYTILADKGAYTNIFAAPQYGFYSFYLKPIFDIIGINVFNFTFVMTILYLVALLFVIVPVVKIIRNFVLKILFIFSFVSLQGLQSYLFTPDPYFQYYPIRFIFPAVSVFLLFKLIKSKEYSRQLFISMIASSILGYFILWNLDSGIVTLIAWLGFISIFSLQKILQDKKNNIKSYSIFFILNLLCAGIFSMIALFLIIRYNAIELPFSKFFEMQKLFYKQGLMMITLPLQLHPWLIVASIYIVAFSIGLYKILRNHSICSFKNLLAFYLSILGIGLFSYYQGRSHDLNLPTVSWPFLTICFLFSDRLWKTSTIKNFKFLRFIILPFLIFTSALSLRLIAISPKIISKSEALLSLKKNKEFKAKEKVFLNTIEWLSTFSYPPSNTSLILYNEALLYAESGLRPAVYLPSFEENFITTSQDIETSKFLSSSVIRNLFLPLNWRNKYNFYGIEKSIDETFELKQSYPLEYWVYSGKKNN